MQIRINNLKRDLPAIEALLVQPIFCKFDDDVANIELICSSIIVNEDRISIEFEDGYIGDYEMHIYDYSSIEIA